METPHYFISQTFLPFAKAGISALYIATQELIQHPANPQEINVSRILTNDIFPQFSSVYQQDPASIHPSVSNFINQGGITLAIARLGTLLEQHLEPIKTVDSSSGDQTTIYQLTDTQGIDCKPMTDLPVTEVSMRLVQHPDKKNGFFSSQEIQLSKTERGVTHDTRLIMPERGSLQVKFAADRVSDGNEFGEFGRLVHILNRFYLKRSRQLNRIQ